MWTAPGHKVVQGLIGSPCIICPAVDAVSPLDRWTRAFRGRELQNNHDLIFGNGLHGTARTSDRSILPSASLCSSGSAVWQSCRRPILISSGCGMRRASERHRKTFAGCQYNFKGDAGAAICWRAPPREFGGCASTGAGPGQGDGWRDRAAPADTAVRSRPQKAAQDSRRRRG